MCFWVILIHSVIHYKLLCKLVIFWKILDSSGRYFTGWKLYATSAITKFTRFLHCWTFLQKSLKASVSLQEVTNIFTSLHFNHKSVNFTKGIGSIVSGSRDLWLNEVCLCGLRFSRSTSTISAVWPWRKRFVWRSCLPALTHFVD